MSMKKSDRQATVGVIGEAGSMILKGSPQPDQFTCERPSALRPVRLRSARSRVFERPSSQGMGEGIC